MGQKVNPIANRIGVIRTWDSRWFAPRSGYAEFLHEDIRLRDLISKRFYHAGVASVQIERAGNRGKITIATARPGIIIGPKGSEIDALRRELESLTGKTITINIEEVKKTELCAKLVAENVASQLQRRIGFRRAMKKTMQASLDSGALGIRIACSGRLGGAEMSRREWYRKGQVPLHTLRADIDYGLAEAKTKFGVIGIKVWIFKGEKFREKKAAAVKA